MRDHDVRKLRVIPSEGMTAHGEQAVALFDQSGNPLSSGGSPSDILSISKRNYVKWFSLNNPVGTEFTLNYAGEETGPIQWDPIGLAGATVQAALEALPNIGAGNVSVIHYNDQPVRIEMIGELSGDQNLGQIVVNGSGLDVSDGELPGVAGDVEVLSGWSRWGQPPCHIYKQNGRAYIFGRFKAPPVDYYDEDGRTADQILGQWLPTFYVPPEYAPPSSNGQGDWQYVTSDGGLIMSVEFYFDSFPDKFGMMYVSIDSNGTHIAPGGVVNLTEISWPLA